MDEFLKTGTFNLISVVTGLLGVLLATYFYFRTRRDMRLFYSVRSFNIIRDRRESLPDLQVTYRGEAIASATVSKLVLVNSGDVPITTSQVATTEPLAITVSNGTILDTSISAVNNPSCALRLDNTDSSRVLLTFEYLDPNDGAVIRMLHTASGDRDICLTGRIIGFGAPKRMAAYSFAPRILRLFPFSLPSEERAHNRARRVERIRWPLLIATLIVTIGLVMVFIYAPSATIQRSRPLELRWTIAVASTITLIPYWWIVFRLFRFSLPKGLNDFYDLAGTD